MRHSSPAYKKVFANRSFRFLLPTLPAAAVFALLAGCGSGNGTAPTPLNYTSPSGLLPSASASGVPSPLPFPFNTPTPAATPTMSPSPTPSASAPAQIVTGTLRIEDASGNVVATPFTPTSGKAEFPSAFAPSSTATFTFETSEPITDANGVPIKSRSLQVQLPGNTKAGAEVKLGTPFYNRVQYTEKKTIFLTFGSVDRFEYGTESGTDGGTVKLISIVNDVYTFDIDALLTAFPADTEGTINTTGSFHLRGTVSVYAPKPADPFSGIITF